MTNDLNFYDINNYKVHLHLIVSEQAREVGMQLL